MMMMMQKWAFATSYKGILTAKHNQNVLVRFESFAFEREFFYILSYLPNPTARAGYDTRSIFKRSFTGFNSEFSFS